MKTEFELELGLDGSRLNWDDNEPPVRWLDIETRKVETPWRRWQPFMVGVAGMDDPGVFFTEVYSSDDEAELIEWVAACCDGSQVRYGATREFDEMVLRGRFTNARRAHRPTPGRGRTWIAKKSNGKICGSYCVPRLGSGRLMYRVRTYLRLGSVASGR